MPIKKAVFIRIDKLGDLINTLPADQLQAAKNLDITWVVSNAVKPLIVRAIPERKFETIDPQDGKVGFKQLVGILRKIKPDLVIVFYAPWWATLACWWARIQFRAGRLSQWHSFLFLNHGTRQSRSDSEMHESEYNCALVTKAVLAPQEAAPVLKLDITISKHLLEKYALQTKNYVVVHPGMAGSALNWPQNKYNQLIEKLIQTTTVVVTGTSADASYLTEIRPRWETHPQVRWLENQLDFDNLLRILKMAKAVVAPSTGVAHLAASLDTPVYALFSPLKEHSAKRWGPRSPTVTILEPPYEPEFEKNSNLQLMEKISASHVVSLIEQH